MQRNLKKNLTPTEKTVDFSPKFSQITETIVKWRNPAPTMLNSGELASLQLKILSRKSSYHSVSLRVTGSWENLPSLVVKWPSLGFLLFQVTYFSVSSCPQFNSCLCFLLFWFCFCEIFQCFSFEDIVNYSDVNIDFIAMTMTFKS